MPETAEHGTLLVRQAVSEGWYDYVLIAVAQGEHPDHLWTRVFSRPRSHEALRSICFAALNYVDCLPPANALA